MPTFQPGTEKLYFFKLYFYTFFIILACRKNYPLPVTTQRFSCADWDTPAHKLKLRGSISLTSLSVSILTSSSPVFEVVLCRSTTASASL